MPLLLLAVGWSHYVIFLAVLQGLPIRRILMGQTVASSVNRADRERGLTISFNILKLQRNVNLGTIRTRNALEGGLDK